MKAPAPVAPTGWVLVPETPTAAMAKAGCYRYCDAFVRDYKAMIAAAPLAPAPVAQGEPVAWIEEVTQTVELIADAEHSNGPTPGKVHRAVLRDLLQKAAARMSASAAPRPDLSAKRHYDDTLFRVWPDGTVQCAEDGETHSHMSDDYIVVAARDEDEARKRADQ